MRELEYESSYVIGNLNEIIYIQDNEVKNIAECNLLHDIIITPKSTKNINSHYSPIINGCIKIKRGKAKFNNLHVLFDSGCSSTG